jgi:hypothetical protein
LKLALTAGRDVQKMAFGEIPGGKALPVAGAKLAIAGQEQNVKTQPADKTAVFKFNLKGGQKTTMQGWFQDAAGADISGAFYATVKRL